jgi:uncharacterized protein (DUF2147 family)
MMHRHLLALSILCALAAGTPRPAWSAPETPVGTWRTFDDGGRETGRVEIWEQAGVLYGRVVAIDDPAKAKAVCLKCEGERKDKPVLGMQILGGLKKDGDRWTGGLILDPENGSTYDCTMRVDDDGRKLVVRGFLGISLLGRSQTWVRAE